MQPLRQEAGQILGTQYFFLLLVFVQLLFEGGVCFLEKPIDIDDGWITLIQAIQ